MLLCANLAFLVSCSRAGSETAVTATVPAGPLDDMEVLSAAQTYFEQEYADLPENDGRRFSAFEIKLLSLIETEDFLADVQWPETQVVASLSSTQTAADYLRTQDVWLVKVYFYAEYQPEILYLGPQYQDGDNTVYVAVEPGRITPLTGWQGGDGANPSTSEEAKALRLTQRQYLMLTHQTAALYAAGLTDFSDPAELTGEQLARYLTVRGEEYFDQQAGWLDVDYPNQIAWVIMNIDFTGEPDVWSAGREFNADRVKFTAGELAQGANIPTLPALTWSYSSSGGSLVATGTDSGGTVRQTYTFAAADSAPGDTLPGLARTYCTGAASR